MATNSTPRLPHTSVQETANTSVSGDVNFGGSHWSNAGGMQKQSGAEVATPGQIAAGAKGSLTVMPTDLRLKATGKGSSIDFTKPM